MLFIGSYKSCFYGRKEGVREYPQVWGWSTFSFAKKLSQLPGLFVLLSVVAGRRDLPKKRGQINGISEEIRERFETLSFYFAEVFLVLLLLLQGLLLPTCDICQVRPSTPEISE